MKIPHLLTLCLGIGTFLQTTDLCRATEEYVREVRLPPLKLSYDDAVSLLRKVDGFVTHANGVSPSNIIHSLEVAGNGREIKYRGSFDKLDVTKFPETGYDLSYLFSASTLDTDKPPISDVTILCNDSFRTAKVKGQNQDQVDSLFLLIVDDLEKHSMWLGGAIQRLPFGMFLTFLCMALGLVFAWRFDSVRYRYVGMTIGLLLIPAFWILPMEKILPGFIIMSGEASFIRRYSAEIGFYGTIIPLLVTGLFAATRKIREGTTIRGSEQREEKMTGKGKKGK